EAGYDLVLIAEKIALLITDDGAQDSYLENSRDCFRDLGSHVAVSQREVDVTAILDIPGGLDRKVRPRKALVEIVGVVDLRPALVLRDVPLRVIPLTRPGIDAPAAE